ncbi:hypothetical protein AAVH_37958, partial [Aphelenchoides avenae]
LGGDVLAAAAVDALEASIAPDYHHNRAGHQWLAPMTSPRHRGASGSGDDVSSTFH